jgi:protein SCO1
VRFVLGSRRELAPVWRGYGIAPQRRGLEHSAYVVVVDGRGRQRIGFPAAKLTPEGLAHDLRALS